MILMKDARTHHRDNQDRVRIERHVVSFELLRNLDSGGLRLVYDLMMRECDEIPPWEEFEKEISKFVRENG